MEDNPTTLTSKRLVVLVFHISNPTPNKSSIFTPPSASSLVIAPLTKDTSACLSSSGKIYISRNVLFHEFDFPYLELFPSYAAGPTLVESGPSMSLSDCQRRLPLSDLRSTFVPQVTNPVVTNSNTDNDLHQLPSSTAPPILSTHGMVTRSQTGSLKPRVFSALCQSPSSSLVIEPTNAKVALADPRWKQATVEEYDALMKNNMWSLVPQLLVSI